VDLLAPRNAQAKAAAKTLKNSAERRNASFDPIVAGIHSGKIQYVDDTFTGDFNAAISRALRSYGAKFNKQTKSYSVLPQQLPAEVLEAAAEYARVAKELHDELEKRLSEIQAGLSAALSRKSVDATVTVGKMDRSFNGAYGDALGTESLSEHAKDALARKYTDSIRPYIEEFSSKMILELREAVADNAKAGYRFDNLVERLQSRYGVSQSKAEFLARNETSRFISEHRRQRFGDAGVKQYVWQTAGDTRVREDHKKLNGKIFDYAHPPIVDEASGRRANPGFDFQCRCVDSPVLPGVLVNA
jgi:SPP1 gp7 family putative phage head morphogenesis protein